MRNSLQRTSIVALALLCACSTRPADDAGKTARSENAAPAGAQGMEDGAGTGMDSMESQPATKPAPVIAETADGIGRVELSEAEWRERLTDEQFYILREAGTERAGTGHLLKSKTAGTYVCAGCGLSLFDSATKFESGTGWPSFYAPVEGGHVAEKSDKSHGWNRVEVLCARCDGHLGHVFEDGPKPTGLRYCINSASLELLTE